MDLESFKYEGNELPFHSLQEMKFVQHEDEQYKN